MTGLHLLTDTELPTEDEQDGFGALRTGRGNLPLEEVAIRAAITGLTSHTELTQSFRNPFPEPLEATYVFPLPSRSAVTALRMEAGGRIVEGVLRERGEARASYDRAIAAGQRASIAEEERPGVFTMRVGNIQPGEQVTARLTLAGQLSYQDGAASYRFPLVVAPRYIPGAPLDGEQAGDGTALDTDAVPDASRITPPVLLPGFPNPVRFTAELTVDPGGLAIGAISCSLPATIAGGTVRIAPGERLDRDLVLRLAAGDPDAVTTGLAAATDGTFALTVLPPAGSAPVRPRDVVLVLDRSGSMAGWKMVAARRAAASIADTLTSADRFAVLAFDNVIETPAGNPPARETPAGGLAPATAGHRARAVAFLRELAARGGTEMLEPLRRAADLLGDPERDRVLVLITDGQVGNEDQILRGLLPRLGGVRVYTVGIDTAVNEGFLRRLAVASGGRCELAESPDRLDEALTGIHRRIGGPLVTGLSVAAPGIAEVTPDRLPDLYPGAAVTIGGRLPPGTGSVTVSGRLAGGQDWRQEVAVPARPASGAGITASWARGRVRDLEDRYAIAESGDTSGLSALERELTEVSLRNGVLCRFTAFVAIDSQVMPGGELRRVIQPVELPGGWETPHLAGGFAAMQAMPAVAGMPAAGPMMTRGLGAIRPLRAPQGPRPGRRQDQPRPAGGGSGPSGAAAALADRYLKRLRALAGAPLPDRRAALAELATAVRDLAAAGEDRTLARLGAELKELAADVDAAEFERRWLIVLDALEALASPSRPPFWRR